MLPAIPRRAARDVDDAAPLVTAKSRWAATSAASGRIDAAQAASASGLVMLCHSLLSRHLEKELMSPSSAQLGIERLQPYYGLQYEQRTSTGRPRGHLKASIFVNRDEAGRLIRLRQQGERQHACSLDAATQNAGDMPVSLTPGL